MKRTTLHVLGLTGIALAVVAMSVVVWYTRQRTVGVYTDDTAIFEPQEKINPRDVLWQPAEALPEPLTTSGDDYEPMVSADGSTLLFVRGKPGENADIYTAQRTIDGWGEPQPIEEINTPDDELGPELSADGSRLYFYSNRSGGRGLYDVWMSVRDAEAQAWGEPVNLGPNVNSPFDEFGVAASPDGQTLFVASNRPRVQVEEQIVEDAWDATLRRSRIPQREHDYDLYRVTTTERGWSVAQRAAELSTPFDDGSPAFSPFGDFLYFASDRPGGIGGFDLYRARLHPDGEIGAVDHLAEAVNTPSHELDPALTMGGFRLLFSSDRNAPTGTDAAEAIAMAEQGRYDLFQSTSREVYTQYRTVRSSIDWGAILPWLLWLALLLLTLLLLWLLTRLVKSERFGRLGLLARCLLISMMVHALLVLLLGAWGVGNSLANWARQGSGVQVAVTSPAVGVELVRQVRGEFTEAHVEANVEAMRQFEQTTPTPEAVDLKLMNVARADIPLRRIIEQAAQNDALAPETELVERDDTRKPDAAQSSRLDLPETRQAQSRNEAVAEASIARSQIERAQDQTFEQQEQVQSTDIAVQANREALEQMTRDSMVADQRTEDASAVESEVIDGERLSAVNVDVDRAADAAEQLPPVSQAAAANTSEASNDATGLAALQTSQQETVDATVLAADEQEAVELPTARSNPSDVSRFAVDASTTKDAAAPVLAIRDATAELVVDDLSDVDDAANVELPVTAARQEMQDEAVAETSADHSLVTSRLTDAAANAPPDVELALTSIAPPPAVEIDAVTLPPNIEAVDFSVDAPPLVIDTDIARLDDSMQPPDQSDTELRLPETAQAKRHDESQQAQSEQELQDFATHMQTDRADASAVMQTNNAPPDAIVETSVDSAMAALNTDRSLAIDAQADSQMDAAIAIPPAIEISDEALTLSDDASMSDVALPEAAANANVEQSQTAEASINHETGMFQLDTHRAQLNDAPPPDQLDDSHDAQLSAPPSQWRDQTLVEDVDGLVDVPPGALANAVEAPTVIIIDESLAGLDEIELPTEVEPPVPAYDPARGVIFGVVTDATTDEPLVGAVVMLDTSQGEPATSTTDDQGRYTIIPPPLPEFAAMSASADEYVPRTLNVQARQVEGAMFRLDFQLVPSNAAVVIVEADPQVHHLGDNSFSGRINSQFQKESEGLEYRASFSLTQAQIDACEGTVEFRVLARGTQRENPIHVNGRRIDKTLNHGPDDGSFGEFIAQFPARWLRAGENTVRINSVGRSDDPDDFEFVNIRFMLRPGEFTDNLFDELFNFGDRGRRNNNNRRRDGG